MLFHVLLFDDVSFLSGSAVTDKILSSSLCLEKDWHSFLIVEAGISVSMFIGGGIWLYSITGDDFSRKMLFWYSWGFLAGKSASLISVSYTDLCHLYYIL